MAVTTFPLHGFYSPSFSVIAARIEFHHTWLWGALLCIFATALTALGLVVQKLSHTLNEQSTKSVVYYRQPLWLAGFSIFVVAQILNLIPMTAAPQVMLSCLGATALIFNAIFAWMILREALHAFELTVMFGMVCGVIMVISTTPVLEADSIPNRTLYDVVSPLFAAPFLVITACILTLLLVLRLAVVDSDFASRWPDVDPLSWTLCAAFSSGYAVNLFKAVSEFIVAWPYTLPHVHWECYVILAVAVLFAVSQVHCLNRALNLGGAMVVVPAYFALGLLAQLLISELVEVCLPQTTLHSLVFTCGIVLIVVFIVVLARVRIAYEEELNGEFEDVMEKTWSWRSTSQKVPTDTTQLLPAVPSTTSLSRSGSARSVSSDAPYCHAKTLPPVRFQSSHDEDFGEGPLPYGKARSMLGEGQPAYGRARSMSSWDRDAFQESFLGRERRYTVSVIGLGIA